MVNSENDLPSDFDLLSPGNTTMVTDLTPEFHWDESTDPDLLGFNSILQCLYKHR